MAESDLRSSEGCDGLDGQSLNKLLGQPRQLGEVEKDCGQKMPSLQHFALHPRSPSNLESKQL